MIKLVYTGSVPTTFMSHPVSLQPGDEFYVPDDLLESYLRRSDIELAPVEEPEAEVEAPEAEAPAKTTKKAAQ